MRLLKEGGGEEGAGIVGIKMKRAGLVGVVAAQIEDRGIRVHLVVRYREPLKVNLLKISVVLLL